MRWSLVVDSWHCVQVASHSSWRQRRRDDDGAAPPTVQVAIVDVGRGNPAAEERRTWLEPFFHDSFVTYITRGAAGRAGALAGDIDLALSHAEAAIRADMMRADTLPAYYPAVLRPAAVALAARADRAAAARSAGDAGRGGD